jgi:hypothetical protein
MQSTRPLLLVLACLLPTAAWAAQGKLTISLVDAKTNAPVAARMHLQTARGKAVKLPRTPFWKDHFPLDKTKTFRLRPGAYEFQIERGPEYRVVSGHFEIRDDAEDTKVVTLHRFVDMATQGWWSGDLHVHRRPRDVPLLMRANDLHIAPVISWWNAQGRYHTLPPLSKPVMELAENRFYSTRAGEDERAGGAVLYFNLARPLDLKEATADYPPSIHFLRLARKQAAAEPGPVPLHIDAEKPFWWDLPVWLASGLVDSIGLANNHMLRGGMLDNEAWGKPRDKIRFPSPLGNGRWSEAIYYQILNSGLRIPPSAGSASGVLANPVGYNRVYVYCGDTLSYATWWQQLRAGQVFVTNGPLLMPTVNGKLPGHVFRGEQGTSVALDIALKLWTRDRIEYLQVIKDGKVHHEARLDEWAAKGGQLPRVSFDRSGWLLIRAVTANPKTYRFASTGPYYVQIGSAPRISRAATQLFVDWIDARITQIERKQFTGRDEVLDQFRTARQYWQRRTNQANAD